jgi:hypothetical protein
MKYYRKASDDSVLNGRYSAKTLFYRCAVAVIVHAGQTDRRDNIGNPHGKVFLSGDNNELDAPLR